MHRVVACAALPVVKEDGRYDIRALEAKEALDKEVAAARLAAEAEKRISAYTQPSTAPELDALLAKLAAAKSSTPK